MELPAHPRGGKATGQYMTSDDGSVKVPANLIDQEGIKNVREAFDKYKWNDEDYMLATYPKNGTHFMWEAMSMLCRGSPEYIKEPKALCMIDMFPVTKLDGLFPSPRVLNTHYRMDVLPAKFRDRKTVLVLRNPKDVCVSFFFMETKLFTSLSRAALVMGDLKFSDYLKTFLYGNDRPYGNYFEYTEYMWSLRDNPNIHLVFFEDLIKNPVDEIEKVNKFMGTERSPELIQQIAEATNFSKMKEGKLNINVNKDLLQSMRGTAEDVKKYSELLYRKGQVGNWKENFSVADNELFDSFLEKWTAGKDIPFTYV